MQTLKLFGTAVIGLASLLSFSANAASINLAPSADGSVKTFGGVTINTTGTAISFSQSGGNIRNAILEFDLSGLSNSVTINNVSLELTLTGFVSNTGNNPAAIDIFAYAGDGIIDLADYSATGTQVVDTSTPYGGSAGDTRSFMFTDITPIQDAAGGLLTLRLETNSFATVRFAGLENSSLAPANLQINYAAVPVPAALPLFASGLAAFAFMRRKQKRC